MIVVFLFPPLGALLFGEGSALVSGTGKLKALLDVGFCGMVVNTIVFVVVSRFTTPPDTAHREAFCPRLEKPTTTERRPTNFQIMNTPSYSQLPSYPDHHRRLLSGP
jgi:hypothetical protein